ncbi:hypothetical protein GCM10017673_14200 [Streptosporangium violaceochromogenes]|nr:hypothetical protein GCM10017673_14200 [Streptosporangium violaceochromogenes]
MSGGGNRSGQYAEQRGRIAERTFLDRVEWWLWNSGGPQPAQLAPDTQKIDYRIVVPSLWAQADSIPLNWQVKATDRFLVAQDSPLGYPCIRYEMRRHDLESLHEFSTSNSSLFLALAIQRNPQQVPNDLLLVPPPERFTWYALNLTEYFRRVEWRQLGRALFIPMQNRLNLATFSLLWSALWVDRFFGVLAGPDLMSAPRLRATIPRVFDRRESLLLTPTGDWDFLFKELPRHQPELDPPMFRKVNFRLGLAGALSIIRKRMYDAADRLDVVRNYCPESLYGTANLWLFSSAYHHFMSTTGEIAGERTDFVSQRLLPLPEDEIRETPRILLSTLWHVVLLYRALGTDVHLVTKPAQNAGDDYSYYGGGIGYFPWITLDGDQAEWMIEMETTRSMSDNLDFINDQAREKQLGAAHTVADAARLFNVPKNELALPRACPHLFFPMESIFVRYPRELFVTPGVRRP